MQLIKTSDGSVTFYSEEFTEFYHSKSGAFEEALKKFVIASHLKKGERVLDVCFGLGYNSFIAIQNVPDISIVALEKNQDILDEALKLDIEGFEVIKELIREKKVGKHRLIIGDAFETIDQVEEVDVIFHDPFSLTRMPKLWSEEFFKKAYDKLPKGGRLVTYSCARQVRDNLKKVGFKVEDVTPLHRRGPSTLAIKI